jgi:hypothetical protein
VVEIREVAELNVFYDLRVNTTEVEEAGYCWLACGSPSSVLLGSTLLQYMRKYAGSCTEAVAYRHSISPCRLAVLLLAACSMLEWAYSIVSMLQHKPATWLLSILHGFIQLEPVTKMRSKKMQVTPYH